MNNRQRRQCMGRHSRGCVAAIRRCKAEVRQN